MSGLSETTTIGSYAQNLGLFSFSVVALSLGNQPYGNRKKSLNTAHMFSILVCE